jgi:protein-L-isoaspartate(D-aspartate) O-methyltransferase
MIDFAVARRMMVDGQVRTADVTDPLVVDAMLATPRELFMPDGKQDIAYLDLAVPLTGIAPGNPVRRLLTPMVLAKLLQALEIQGGDSVLDVGCGTGYSAAILARIAKSVVALEDSPELAGRATQSLAAAGAANVAVVSGPLPAGWPNEGPYDAILVEGATEFRPEVLFGQLREGGRLACISGRGPAAKAMLYRAFEGDVSGRPIFDAAAGVLPGFAAPDVFVF